MLIFEFSENMKRLDVSGNKAGLLKFAQLLTELAGSKSSDYVYVLTKNFSGDELLSNEKEIHNSTSILLNCVKVYFIR